MIVGELGISFERVRTKTERLAPDPGMIGIDEPGGQQAGIGCLDQNFELVVLLCRNKFVQVLNSLLDRTKKEHAVPNDRAAERSAEVLAAVRRLLPVGLQGEVVLRRQLAIALVAKDRAVQYVRPRLGNQGDGCTARA